MNQIDHLKRRIESFEQSITRALEKIRDREQRNIEKINKEIERVKARERTSGTVRGVCNRKPNITDPFDGSSHMLVWLRTYASELYPILCLIGEERRTR